MRENGQLANDTQLMRDTVAGSPDGVALGGGGFFPDNPIRRADVSDDGLVVAFISSVSLRASDTNDTPDVYLRDLSTGTTTQVTTSQSGLGPQLVAISGDARFVVFESRSSNLVAGDGTDSDLFVWTRATGAVRKLTSGVDGGSNGDGLFRNLDISRDGRTVFFSSSAPAIVLPSPLPVGAPAVYRWDEGRGVSLVHAVGTGSCGPVIVGGGGSGDGTTSTFMTTAGLVGADTNGLLDVYAQGADGGRFFGSQGPGGAFDAGPCGVPVAQWPDVSFDGSRLAFELDKRAVGEGAVGPHVVVRDVGASGFVVVSPGDAGLWPAFASRFPFVDASGQRVSFVSNAPAVPGPAPSLFSYRCFLSELNGRQLVRTTALVGDVDGGFPPCLAAKVSGNGHAVLVVTPAVLSPGDRTVDGGTADLDLYLRLVP